MDRARKAFKHADVEGKGFLSRHQYRIAMTVVFGYCPERWEVKQEFSNSLNPENLMSLKKFVNCVRRKIDPTCKNLPDLESLFASLDKKLKGYLVSEDFLIAAKEVDLRISTPILENTFKELDLRRKGYIEMDEFVEMIGDKE